MPVTLCLDFGNTRKKIAIFEGADLVRTQVINDDAPETINSLPEETLRDALESVEAEIVGE